MVAPVREGETGSRDKVAHSAGYQDLTRGGQTEDPRRNVDGDSRDILPSELHLAGVDARPDLKTEAREIVTYRKRATNRSRRAIERGEESVAEAFDLTTAIAR